MSLHTLTITGPDNFTNISDLTTLSMAFPFVEWGILLTTDNHQRKGFPTFDWIESLQSKKTETLRVSAHLCGKAAHNVARGIFDKQFDLPLFKRMQLNMANFIPKEKDFKQMSNCLPKNREYIIQVGSSQQKAIGLAIFLQNEGGHKVSLLFDRSGGKGLSPSKWPESISGLKCGFAGGLGPDNLADELALLSRGNENFWIDMQSKVRTGEQLDLNKVSSVLEITAKHINS